VTTVEGVEEARQDGAPLGGAVEVQVVRRGVELTTSAVGWRDIRAATSGATTPAPETTSSAGQDKLAHGSQGAHCAHARGRRGPRPGDGA
jgi:hypothetical protein